MVCGLPMDQLSQDFTASGDKIFLRSQGLWGYSIIHLTNKHLIKTNWVSHYVKFWNKKEGKKKKTVSSFKKVAIDIER